MKRMILIIFVIFIIPTSCLASNSIDKAIMKQAKEKTKVVENTVKVIDDAELLTNEEETKLYKQVQKYIEKYNMDMVIVTINHNNKASSMEYADDFYDYNNYGIGDNKSGVLFLIDMQKRKMWISTTGSAIEIYNDVRIDKILEYTYKNIKEEKYYDCCKEFIDKASYFAKKGKYGSNNIITIESITITSLVLSIIITAIYIAIGYYNQRKLKPQKKAENYARQFKIVKELDRFIDVKQTRRYSPVESSSGSSSSSSGSSHSSSTHTSSSGSTHGGGGRSF